MVIGTLNHATCVVYLPKSVVKHHRKKCQIPLLGTKGEFVGFSRNIQQNPKTDITWENDTVPNVNFVGYYNFPSLVI